MRRNEVRRAVGDRGLGRRAWPGGEGSQGEGGHDGGGGGIGRNRGRRSLLIPLDARLFAPFGRGGGQKSEG